MILKKKKKFFNLKNIKYRCKGIKRESQTKCQRNREKLVSKRKEKPSIKEKGITRSQRETKPGVKENRKTGVNELEKPGI